MKLNEIAEKLALKNLTPEIKPTDYPDVTRGYTSDMLSDVLANAPNGCVLVTIQLHMNVIAVSVHAGIVAVIFAGGRAPEETVRQKAIEEKIFLYASPESAFDIVGRLHSLGLKGRGG